jgi:hypothetical protein
MGTSVIYADLGDAKDAVCDRAGEVTANRLVAEGWHMVGCHSIDAVLDKKSGSFRRLWWP